MIRALVIARDKTHQGGVVSFVELLVANFSQNVQASRFVIGRNPDKHSRVGALATTLYDSIRLAKVVRQQQPHIIHINPSLDFSAMLRDGLLITALAIINAPPIVMFIHGWDEAFLARMQNSRAAGYLFRKLLNRATCIIVRANRFKEALLAFGIEAQKIHVTTTMFDPALFEGIRRERQNPGPRLLFLSRLVKEKGAQELLEAFLILQASQPDLTLTIAGDGPEYHNLDRWVKEHRLGHRIVLTGYLRGEAKAHALIDADIFVFPSYYGDGCPVSLLEAMAAGLAVVTTPVGGIPDFFVDGKNGSLLDAVSPASIADGILKLLRDKHLLGIIRENNRLTAWKNYDAATITVGIEEIYQCALDTSRAG